MGIKWLLVLIVFVASLGTGAIAQTQGNMIEAERQKNATDVLARIAGDFSTKLEVMSLAEQDQFWSLERASEAVKDPKTKLVRTKADHLLRISKHLPTLAKYNLGGGQVSIEPVLELPKGIGDCTLVGTYIKAGLPSSLEMPHKHVGVLVRAFSNGSIIYFGIRWDNGKKLSIYVPDDRPSYADRITKDVQLQKKCREFFGDKAVSVSPY